MSEGFTRNGFKAIAHVEMDPAACYTLKTRQAYNYLKNHNKEKVYYDYIKNKISREEFYNNIPKEVLNTVLNYEISPITIPEIFNKIDNMLGNNKISIVVGGPPCQAYSLVGRSRDKNKMVGDKRNYLYKLYANFLEKYKPEYFVFENVLGILSAKDTDGKLHFDKMLKLFKKCGYSTEYKVLSATDYGILQNRKRVVIVGKKGKHKDFYPEIDKIEIPEDVYVNEIFSDLPSLKSGEGKYKAIKTKNYKGTYLYNAGIKTENKEYTTFHISRLNNERDLKIYRLAVQLWNKSKERLNYKNIPKELQTHKNIESFLDRYKVVAGDIKHSHTVVAHVSKDGHYYIHPDLKQNRSLTPREIARLQTFPDSYYFESISGIPSRTTAYKQIGNAVPVLMASQIAKAILKNF